MVWLNWVRTFFPKKIPQTVKQLLLHKVTTIANMYTCSVKSHYITDHFSLCGKFSFILFLITCFSSYSGGKMLRKFNLSINLKKKTAKKTHIVVCLFACLMYSTKKKKKHKLYHYGIIHIMKFSTTLKRSKKNRFLFRLKSSKKYQEKTSHSLRKLSINFISVFLFRKIFLWQ